MASGNTQRGALARFSLRTIALIVGLVGSVLALIVNLLYGFFHVLGRVAGIANDSSHFFLGLLVVLIGVFGSLMAPVLPVLAEIALAVAGIAFFFVVGWWALFVSPFFLVAALLTISNRRANLPSAT